MTKAMVTPVPTLSPAMVKSLRDHFVPKVAAVLNKIDFEVHLDVRYVEYMEMSDGQMCYLTIEVSGSPCIEALNVMTSALDKKYCTNDDPVFVKGGRRWILGDGDDATAVFFEEGKFNIWLRGWRGPVV